MRRRWISNVGSAILILASSISLSGQPTPPPFSPIFPGRAITDADIGLRSDFCTTTLSNQMGKSDPTFTVTSSVGCPTSNFVAQIGQERIFVTSVSGSTWTVGQRGFDGTRAVGHINGLAVTTPQVMDYQWNRIVAELEAVQTWCLSNCGGGGGGGGGISGPSTTTVNNLVTWNSTTGTLVGTGIGYNTACSANMIPETGSGGTLALGCLPASVITTSSTGLVTNALLQNSAVTIGTTAPLSGGGSVSLGGTLPLSIATSSASVVGAGNVAGTSGQLSVTYNVGGTGTIAFTDPTNFDVVSASAMTTTGNIGIGGAVYSANSFNSSYLGTSIASANYVSGVTLTGAGPFTCTFTFTGVGGGSGAVFTTTSAGPTLSAGALVLSTGGSGYTSNPATATVGPTTGSNTCTGTPVLTTLLTGGSIHLHDGAGNDVPIYATYPNADQVQGAWQIFPPAVSSGSPLTALNVTSPTNTGMTGTAPAVYFNFGTQTYATLPASYIGFSVGSTILSGAGTVSYSGVSSMAGPAIANSGVNITRDNGLQILSQAVNSSGGTVTTASSAFFAAPSGAANNYSLSLGNSTNTPPTLEVTFDGSGNEVSQGSVTAANLIANPTATPFTGTSGAASCSEGLTGTQKMSTCILNAYANTGSAQTYNFPTAFTVLPVMLQSASGGGSTCGTYVPTRTTTVLTLPANASMTAETCVIVLLGQ